MSGDWRRTTLILFEVGVNRVFDRFTYPCMYVWRSRHPLEQPYLLPATASSGKGALARVIVVLASLPPQLSLLLLILAWSRQRDLLWHEQFFSRYPHGTNSRENQVIFRETKKKKRKKKEGRQITHCHITLKTHHKLVCNGRMTLYFLSASGVALQGFQLFGFARYT